MTIHENITPLLSQQVEVYPTLGSKYHVIGILYFSFERGKYWVDCPARTSFYLGDVIRVNDNRIYLQENNL
jgi:hypothetical protein